MRALIAVLLIALTVGIASGTAARRRLDAVARAEPRRRRAGVRRRQRRGPRS